MILLGNGIELTVPGKNIKVSVGQDFARDDMSGSGSDSEVAPGGIKPKTVSVSLTLSNDRADDLKKIQKAAEALDDELSPMKFTVSDLLCNAFGIRDVIFVGSLNVSESSGLRAWDVSFSLREKTTAAEAKEAREEKKEIPPAISGVNVVKYTTVSEASKGFAGGVDQKLNVYDTVLAQNNPSENGTVTA